MSDLIYTYSFVPHPDPRSPRWNADTFDLFRQMGPPRVAMEFTELEFREYREQLAKCDIEICEVERVPYHEPECVP